MPFTRMHLLLASLAWQLCRAGSSESLAVPEAAVAELAVPPRTPPGWSCDIRAWVRAPDLAPNLVSAADARLVANGSDCAALVRWDVKLSFKERSIARLASVDAELPTKPEWNETEETAYYASLGPCGDWNDIFNFGMGCNRNESTKSPFMIKDEAYRTAMTNDSLWELHSAEKVVFESSVTLAEGKEGIPLKAVRSFALAVPNINLPPTPTDYNGVFWDSDNAEFSEVETALQYLFVFTLRNGSTIEVPAGKTAFAPVQSVDVPKQAERHQVEMRPLPTTDRPFTTAVSTPNSTRAWELDVKLPEGSQLVQGQYVELEVTVKRVNESTETMPTALQLELTNTINKTWAASFGHTAEQRRSLGGEAGRQLTWPDPPAYMPQLVPREENCPKDAEPVSLRMWPGSQRDRKHAARATLHQLDEERVSLNFTVPADFLPSSQSTFLSTVALLHFRLETRKPDSETAQLDDPYDEGAWSSYPRCPSSPEASISLVESSHVGNITVEVLPAATHDAKLSTPASYLEVGCPTPVLLPSVPADSSKIKFGRINTQVRKETPEEGRKRQRYSGLMRVPFFDDGAMQHAGQLWARKLKREAKVAAGSGSTDGQLVVQARH